MKKSNSTFPLFILCFILCCAAPEVSLFAQGSLPLPKIIPAGKPQVIQVPRTAGGSYVNAHAVIKLQPPRVFTLPVVTIRLPGNKEEKLPDQYAAGQGLFTAFTTENGLTLDAISSSCMDRLGNIWFGTYGGGVCRYDGKSFTTYTTAQGLGNNLVRSIYEDRSGNIWFGTNDGGVSRYDGRSFTTYTTAQGLANNTVWSIAQDKNGDLWFGTRGGGISRYHTDIKDGKAARFTNYSTGDAAGNTVRCIQEDRTGNLWFGTAGAGIFRYDGRSFTNYTTAQGLPDNAVLSMLEDKAGNLWFGTQGGSLGKYDGKSFSSYTAAQGLGNSAVWDILEGKNGDLWFGTYGGGIFRYEEHPKDGSAARFTHYTTAQGLSSNAVLTLVEDKTGNLWMGTYGGGISVFGGESFVYYTAAQGLGNNVVWSILEDKTGNLWFGTENGGASRYDGKSFVNYTQAQGLANNTVLSMLEDRKGNIWFGTQGFGVSKYDGYSFANYTTAQGLADNTVRSILEDKIGNLWFGTEGGMSKYDGHSFTNYTTAQGLPHNTVYSIVQDKTGNLWLGTLLGVSRYEEHAARFTNYTTGHGLSNNSVFNILEDKTGNLWFGTQQGLSYLAADKAALPAASQKESEKGSGTLLFTAITTADGLPDDFVTQVLELPNGKIAAGTNIGIALFNPPGPEVKELKGLELFNASIGYPVKDVNAGQHAMYKDSKGILWIATGSDRTGLVRFDYSSVPHRLSPPTVIIQSIRINEENICWENLRKPGTGDSLSFLMAQFHAFGKNVGRNILDSQRARSGDIQFDSISAFYPLPGNLVLPYDHNQISFEFAAIEPARSYLVKYQYILEGYDKEWSPVTRKTSVSFGNMYEGTYTFKLKAQSPFEVWSEPVTYTFTVLPPWWRNWWMYSAYVAAGVFIVLFAAWWNGRRLRARARELALEIRKATETISDQKKIVEEQKRVVEEQKNSVEEKNKSITDSINYAKRIQSAILPGTDLVKSFFDDYFIFFQPKEIVSGDFYWFGKKDDKLFFAAVDCTGHGVPGAFMSMIANTLLNEIVNEKGISEPDEILNHLRTAIIYALKQTDAPESQRDGMDIALCMLDKKKNLLEFSGAQNPLYHFRKGIFTEWKGDMHAIGYERGENPAFTKSKIEIQKGDTVYIFTDGFADQKGGAQKRKFYYPTFQQLLASVQHEPMIKQEETLRDTFNTWKGNLEQVDDVLVIGIRL